MIDTREEYDYCLSRGIDPLLGGRIEMAHALRVEIQRERFGKNDAEGNQKFYSYCLRNKPLVCEECGCPIRSPGAINVSHILTRGSHPEMAHDPRNINILCPRHHDMWEHATTRRGMKIEGRNNKTIQLLKTEYNVESNCG